MGLVISKGLTLKSYNTPAAIAGVAPTLDYRFALDRREIEAISLTDKLTYTGATNGTFVNRSGLIERATTDQPRFDHGTLSRQSLGLLVEEERTNLLLRSEELDNAYWVGVNITITANVATAPTGNLTADRVTGSGVLTTQSKTSGSVTAGLGAVAVSFFAKYESHKWLQLFFNGDGTPWANFDVETGAVGATGANTIATITPVGSGWFKCVLIKAAVSDAAVTGCRFVLVDTSNSGRNANSETTGSLLLWGAQLEVGAFPTSYIPTTTTALTRPVDSAVIDGTGVITGTYTLVEKPAGCAVVNGTNIDLVSGFTAERVMVFPAALSAPQITAIRGAM
jgi:hypothetical protein